MNFGNFSSEFLSLMNLNSKCSIIILSFSCQLRIFFLGRNVNGINRGHLTSKAFLPQVLNE